MLKIGQSQEERQILATKVTTLEKQRKDSLQMYENLVKDKLALENDLYSKVNISLSK